MRQLSKHCASDEGFLAPLLLQEVLFLTPQGGVIHWKATGTVISSSDAEGLLAVEANGEHGLMSNEKHGDYQF